LTDLASASSTARQPLQRLNLVKNPSILTPNNRVTAVSTFDVAFDYSGQRIRLNLEPNHDIFVEGAKVQYLAADGSISKEEPLDRMAHKVYKGTAYVKRSNRWENVGWARINIMQDGPEPLFEGAFTMHHDHHHIALSTHYQQMRMDGEPDIPVRDQEYMVIFRNSDMGRKQDEEHSELRKRAVAETCASDSLGFNTHDEHPVYAAMRARSDSNEGTSNKFLSSLMGRQVDSTPGGGNSAGVNLVQSIGSTNGCPTTRKVALVGVATDCTYTQSFNSSTNSTRSNVINQMNRASELFESTFNISLGLANLIVTEPNCPTTPQAATPWNRACSDNFRIENRLNAFSQWRGQQKDSFAYWTLLSTCNTGSAVGLAWLGQACTSGSSSSNSSQGAAETVSSANVVVRTLTEWQVIAHETGHTFGAVHDCTSSSCSNANVVSAQQCCPLSSSTCDAGERFIMNPSTAEGIDRFSPCSIGNICSALGRNSVKSNCLTNNRGVITISQPVCGNGIVEGDEQCDCGGEAGCRGNRCCNPTTCRFQNNAVCDDSNEDCCRECQFASSTTVCRASAGSCDPEERCTGSTPYCPEDKTNPDGSDCGNGLKCASGQCTSRDQQCKSVMGNLGKGNDTYACDNSNCVLSCASPEFGRNVCYGLQQNFLDGTPCVGGGNCNNGQCAGSSVGGEVKTWIDEHRTLVIALSSVIGGLLVLSILGCCISSCRRRRRSKAYAKKAASMQQRGPPPPPTMGYAPNRSRSG
ncbi:zincin, partial [Periconia macrospinosa]